MRVKHNEFCIYDHYLWQIWINTVYLLNSISNISYVLNTLQYVNVISGHQFKSNP